MALLKDAVSAAKGVTASITWAHTVAAGADRVLYVLVSERFASAVTGVTYNGIALTEVNYNNPGTNRTTQKVFRLINPPAGLFNVVVSQSASHNLACTAISFTGAHQTTPNSAFVSTSGGIGTSISDAITSAAGEIVVDLADCMENVAATRTLTVGALQTQESNQEQVSGGAGLQAGVSTEPGAATVTMSWTIDVAEFWTHTAFAVKPSVGDTTPPGPATVQATPDPAGAAISLVLGMPSDGDVSQYEVRRATGDYPLNDRTNGTIVVAATAVQPGAQVNVADAGLVNGTRYFYRVFVRDSSLNWNTGTTVSAVAHTAPGVVGWYTSAGVLKADGETGPNPIYEGVVDAADVEAGKPAMIRLRIGSNNPGANLPPTLDVLEFLSTPADGSAPDGSFKYLDGTFVTIPATGIPWAKIQLGAVTWRYFSALNAVQDMYGSYRVEQA